MRQATALALLLLAACGGGGSGPATRGENVPIEPDRGGHYKVGKPYTIKGVTYVPRVDYGYDETGIASWYGPGFHGKKTANGERYNQRELTAAHKTLPMPSLAEVTNLENGRTVVLRVNDRGPYASGRIIDVSERAAELPNMKRAGIAKVRVRLMPDESRALAQGRRPSVDLSAQPSVLADARVPRRPPPPEILPPDVPPPGLVRLNPPASDMPPPGLPRLASGEPLPPPVPKVPALSTQPVVLTNIFIQAGAFGLRANAERRAKALEGYGPVRVHPVNVNGQTFQRVQIGPLPSVEAADALLDRMIADGHESARVVVEDN